MTLLPGPNYALDDVFLRDRLREVISEHGIDTVVETGLNDGQSTLAFSGIVGKVIGIDIDPACIECTRGGFIQAGRNNYELIVGNSPDVILSMMPRLNAEKTLFFLDAHWDDPTPLLDEIRTIPPGKGIIVFHDFLCPGTDFGWDHVLINGVHRQMDYDLVRTDLTRWSLTHRLEYATKVSASKRGWAIAYPS
jgi:predicted O-methyltransferase YrrM